MKLKKIATIVLATCMFASVNGYVNADTTIPMNDVRKINATFYGDTKTTKAFTWYTSQDYNNSDLEVVEKVDATPNFENSMKFKGKSSIPTNSQQEFVHKAEATGLKENTTYFYRVGDSEKNKWSDIGTFKTAPKEGKFTFIDIADTQAKSEEECILASQTISKAFNTIGNAEFISLNGDLVDKGNIEEQWDWLFGHSQNNLLNTTFVPVAGNHESNEDSFIDHFNLNTPEGADVSTGAYYSYDYSNAHFIILNNNENSDEYADFTPAQIEWMKTDVNVARENGAKWIVVKMHKGPYTTSNHATDDDIMGENGVRTKVAPIMEELEIDLVLQGHDHIYSRTKALKNGEVTDETKIVESFNGNEIEYTVKPDGTIYVTPNTAGPKVYYKNKKIDQSYYDLFEVAKEHPAGQYGSDPSDSSRPVRSQIQNFMGITIDGEKLTAVTYEIDKSKSNGEPYIVDTFGISKKAEITEVLPEEDKQEDVETEEEKNEVIESESKDAYTESPKTADNNIIYTVVIMLSLSGIILVNFKLKREA